MAVVTSKSKAITGRDAKIPVDHAKTLVKEFIGTCPIALGDSVGSKLLFGIIPSNARISSMDIVAPNIGTTTAFDLGLYNPTATDGSAGAVVDADFFAANAPVSAGPSAGVELAFRNAVGTTNAEKMVWQILGLTEDPGKDYDVVATLTGAADAGGTVMLRGTFTT